MTDRHAYEDDLKAYLDGELSLLRRIAVARHLTRCAVCRQEVVQMSQIAEELRPQTDETLDPSLRAKILSDLGAESESPVRIPRRRPRPAALIGAAAALGVIGYAFAPQLMQTHYDIAPSLMSKHAAPEMTAPQAANTIAATRDGNGAVPITETPFQNAPMNNTYASSPPTTDTLNGKPVAIAGRSDVQLNIKAPDSRYMNTPPAAAIKPNSAITFSVKPTDAEASADSPRLVHNEASIGVEVANSESSSTDLETLVKGVGGYVAENSLNTDENGVRSADVTVKVPVDQFDSVMAQIGKFGKVTSKSVTGEDITEKTSDADQAEQVMEDEVRRTDAELKNRGKRVTWRDQEQARDLRIQLNQSRARLELLKKMARLSSIEVTLTEKEKEPPKVTSNFWTSLMASTGSATDSLAAALGRVLALVVWFVAYAPIWVPALLAYRWWAKKNKREEASA